MDLSYENNIFTLNCNIIDNPLAMRAGFAYDRHKRKWVTPFAYIAAKLAYSTGQNLKEILAKKRQDEEIACIKSMSITSGLYVPCNPGLEFDPFQLAGIDYMLGRDNTLLADQMGLGKTIQAIGFCNVVEPNSVLIICPANFKITWLREWVKWSTLPLVASIMYTTEVKKANIYIINYDILIRFYNELRLIEWDVLIIDEVQAIKNHQAQRTKQITGGRLKKKKMSYTPLTAKRILTLTGTPILSRPIEIYNVIKYISPFGWQSRTEFAKRYCDAKEGEYGWNYGGASHLEELQKKLRSTIMVRRLKKDVLPDLPPKRRQVIELDLDTNCRSIINKAKDTLGDFFNFSWETPKEIEASYENIMNTMSMGEGPSFEAISKARHDLAVAKLPAVIEHLREAIDSSGKVVCFCWHRDIAEALLEEFEGAVMLIGGMSPEKQQNAVDTFQNDKAVTLFVGNILAAGKGHTLTASSHCVLAESDWVPGNVSQAEDRLHRRGQKDSVFIQHLVLPESIDVHMARGCIMKQEIIDQAMDHEMDPDLKRMLS